MSQLAVVIPAFKSNYLRETLDCFVHQTSKKFRLYIGDDHSPEPLEAIILEYADRLNVTYHRFENNIGSKNIIDQWVRTISLTRGEEWIWLFSDDDLVDSNAVESFWNIVEKTNATHDIYSFNTCVINKDGSVRTPAPEIPLYETSEQMAYHLLLGKRANCMPDHIFSREVYLNSGGFVRTHFAQGADWGSSIKFSMNKGVRIIPDALVYWRYSGDNISSVAAQHNADMILGHFQFIEWILDNFDYLKQEDPTGIRFKLIQDAALQNLLSVIDYHYKGVPLSKMLPFLSFLRKKFHISIFRLPEFLIKYNALNIRIIRDKISFKP